MVSWIFLYNLAAATAESPEGVVSGVNQRQKGMQILLSRSPTLAKAETPVGPYAGTGSFPSVNVSGVLHVFYIPRFAL